MAESHDTLTLLTCQDVADLAKVHIDTVRKWVRAGIVPTRRLPGGAIRITLTDVHRYILRTSLDDDARRSLMS